MSRGRDGAGSGTGGSNGADLSVESLSHVPEAVHDAPYGYQDLTRIDQGGFAVVYRALDTRFGRTVALKILRSDRLNERQLRRFNAECLATGRVSAHPNIVTVYDAGTTAGHHPWLAMEYCAGGSLAQKVRRTGPLPVAEVISIGARLCDALTAAHEAGILHRDVKPANVLLTSYGEPALADFGIARVRSDDDAGDPASETGAYTVVHAAPEILEGRDGTPAADIYSLGSTLYTLLAGQAPFATEASTGLAPLVSRILRNDVPAIPRPGIPPELERLLRSCMAARPQDRPASAAELGASLTSLGQRLDTATGHRPLPSAGPQASGIGARPVLAILGGTLVALLAVFLAAGASLAGHRPDRAPASAMTRTAPPAAAAPAAAARYLPAGVVVTRGQRRGELVVTWRMPIRPDVVATVIYEGSGTTTARAVVTYPRNVTKAPAATLHGFASGRRVCLSAAHMVSTGGTITTVVGRPVCLAPR